MVQESKQNKVKGQPDEAAEKKVVYPTVGVLGSNGSQAKKRSSSRGVRRLEDIESRVSKSVNRVAKAVRKGVATYMDRRDKSAAKRRGGALVDLFENVARGASTTLSRSSPVVTDVAKALNTRRMRRLIKRSAAFFGSIPFMG